MTARRPLVRIGGKVQLLPEDDFIAGAAPGWGVLYPLFIGDLDSADNPSGNYRYYSSLDAGTPPPGVTAGIVTINAYSPAVVRQVLRQISASADVTAVWERLIFSNGTVLGQWDQVWTARYLPAGTAGKAVLAAGSKQAALAALDINTAVAAGVSAGALDLSGVTVDAVTVALNANVTSIILPAGTDLVRKRLTILFTQDSTGGRTITGWPAATLFAAGPPLLPPGPNQQAVVTLERVGTGPWVVDMAPGMGGGQPLARIGLATSRLIAGAANGTALTTLTLAALKVYYVPFIPARRMSVANIGIAVSTLASGSALLGVYASASVGKGEDVPGARLVAGSSSAVVNSTGTKVVSLNGYYLEAQTLYFLAVLSDVAPVIRAVAVGGQVPLLGFTDNSTTVISNMQETVASFALPAVAGTTTKVSSANPAIYVNETPVS